MPDSTAAPLQCAIVEDERPAAALLEAYVAQMPELALAGTWHSLPVLKAAPLPALDVLFLDIQLQRDSSLDWLRNTPQRPLVVLTTAYPQYAVESYEYGVVDYLLKPIRQDRFQAAVARVRAAVQRRAPLLIKNGHYYEALDLDNLLAVEASRDYVRLHRTDRAQPTVLLGKLADWAERLAPLGFVRVHKSFVVNLRQITEFKAGQVRLGGVHCPVGRAFKAELHAALAGRLW